jgi:hypothetical protein
MALNASIYNFKRELIYKVEGNYIANAAGERIGSKEGNVFYSIEGELLGRIVADQILDNDKVIGKVNEERILNKNSDILGRIIGAYAYDDQGTTLGYSDPELPKEYMISLFFFFFNNPKNILADG